MIPAAQLDQEAHPIPMADRERYRQEATALMHQRVVVALWVGIILIPLFSLLDHVVAPALFKEFFLWRLGCAVLFLFLLLWHRLHPFGHRQPFVTAFIAYILAGSLISLMVARLGGYDPHYFVGILLVLVTCATILPLSLNQALFCGGLLYFIYAATLAIFDGRTLTEAHLLFTNSFFFFSFIVISGVKCWEENRARQREFNLHQQLNAHAEKLSFYAEHLEHEVEKRAQALADSELRYQELYDQVIDMIVLTDREGMIVMANRPFRLFAGLADEFQPLPLRPFVAAASAEQLEAKLFATLKDDRQVQAVQFALVNESEQQLEVECNGKAIVKNDHLVGFQLVIRDITVRKHLEEELQASVRDVHEARYVTIAGLAKLADCRDQDTGNHLERIRAYTRFLAQELATMPDYRGYITDEYIEDLCNSSILHDIGKVGIPDRVLLKPGRLTLEEFEVIKRHCAIGGDALKAAESQIGGQSFLALAKEIAYYHHEKWDGSGYPLGLRGEEITLSTRMVALADVYDALTSPRVYKMAYSHSEAKAIILAGKGTHFCPEVVDAFLAREVDFLRTHHELEGTLSLLPIRG